MKASQTISSEIELDQLLRFLMQILIENDGAQTGYLILENAGVWAIEAACELNEGENVYATQVLQSVPMTNRLPESMIQYVIRTYDSVILNDATREGNFINEPYIQHNQTQSIFCLPLLSTQAAIAIENAKLYSELQASKSQMAQFLEAVPVGIAVFDAAGCPYYFNQRAIPLIGKESNPAVTLDQLAEAYQVYLAGTNQQYPTEKLPSTQAMLSECTTVDDIEIYQDNAVIPVEVWGTPVFDEQGKVTYAIAAFQDITERKQSEHLLANYNRTLEEQVAERTAALQQSEAELRHREQELRLITDALPVCISYVDTDQCYQFVNQTYEGWFSCSRDEILGKSIREEQFVSPLQSSTETHLTYNVVGTPYTPPPETENNLLRIAQEAFTNAMKYAHAHEVRIELAYEPTSCSLRIRDNGQGFEVNHIAARQGFGLLGITERAEHIGAQLSIESQPGHGTEVIIVVQREIAT